MHRRAARLPVVRPRRYCRSRRAGRCRPAVKQRPLHGRIESSPFPVDWRKCAENARQRQSHNASRIRRNGVNERGFPPQIPRPRLRPAAAPGGWRTDDRRARGRGRRRACAPACSPATRSPWRRPTASRMATPCASRAAMAADSVQPVPWVWRVSTRGRTNRSMPEPSHRIVDRRLTRAMPALEQDRAAAEAPQRLGLRDGLRLARGLSAPSRRAASGRLGVIRGRQRDQLALHRLDGIGRQQHIAAGRHHHRIDHQRPPLRPRAAGRPPPRRSPASASIPVLIAPTSRSASTASICATTNAAATGSTPLHAARVLRRERRDHGRAVDAESRERLQVRLDAGAA